MKNRAQTAADPPPPRESPAAHTPRHTAISRTRHTRAVNASPCRYCGRCNVNRSPSGACEDARAPAETCLFYGTLVLHAQDPGDDVYHCCCCCCAPLWRTGEEDGGREAARYYTRRRRQARTVGTASRCSAAAAAADTQHTTTCAPVSRRRYKSRGAPPRPGPPTPPSLPPRKSPPALIHYVCVRVTLHFLVSSFCFR